MRKRGEGEATKTYHGRMESVVTDAWTGLKKCTLSTCQTKLKPSTHVGRNVSQRRITRRTSLNGIPLARHVPNPLTINMLHLSPSVHLTPALQLPPLVCASMIQRGQDLVRDACSDVGDVQECVCEWRRSELVVLRERAGEDVEALRARVGEDDIRDGRAAVVHSERNGKSFSGEKAEKGVVGGVRGAVKGGW